MVSPGGGPSESCEVLVIGSGAGGAVTAAMLAEAGCDVLVAEEGTWLDADVCEPFSLDEMRLKYRNAGPGVALGRPPIAYVEGRCVGGSTEINSALYHRPPPDVVEDWRRRYGLVDCDVKTLDAYAAQIESSISVASIPGRPPSASAALERGATKLGWRSAEIPRLVRYEAGSARGTKQTMSRTFIPRAVSGGARVVPDCRVDRLVTRGRRIVGALATRTLEDGTVQRVVIDAEHLFVCAGAIQTPALLQRSGIRKNIGTRLKVHPTLKLAARFESPVDDHLDVPMHQVREFAPDLTLGGSVSRRGYVAVALSDAWARNAARMEDWERIAVYYAAIRSDGAGRVRALPGLREPLVTYRLTESDLSRLARGLVHLAELLFAAGALELYPSIADAAPLTGPSEVGSLWGRTSRAASNLMTIHMFASIGMGEDASRTGADSYGRVWDVDNLRINDASMLPDAPGVNPQGTIMALAARNAAHFLATGRSRRGTS